MLLCGVVANANHVARILLIKTSSLWKDTDPDMPILKEAKAEYAKLQ